MTTFAEYHSELRAVARAMLAGASPLNRGGAGSEPADWGAISRSGWLALEVPEELDGTGATFAEVAVVLGEMGATATRSSYLGSAVLGIGALKELWAGEDRDDLLRRAGSGRLTLAVALATDDPGPSPAPFRLERSATGLRLHGGAAFVPDAAGADRVLVLARDSGQPVVVVADRDDPGLSVSAVEVTDPTRRVASVTADGAPVAESALWRFTGEADEVAWRLFDRAALAVACDSLGLAEAMMNATVDYARARHQFGRPIGSFQAVKHACADMLVEVSVGRELVAAAIAAVADGEADSGLAVARAKSYVCDAAVGVAGKAMQLHGGIGYTWESGVHVYLKRALFNRAWFGSPGWHRRRLAARYG